MSKSVEESSNDYYGLWREYINDVSSYVEKTIPQYHQAITNLLQESVEMWKNFACSSIDLQREFVKRNGTKLTLPESAVKIASDITQESKTAIDVHNKIAIASIDATKQSLSTLNSNANEFASINKNIISQLPLMAKARF